ncbi:hypothetical protein [Salsipaludibacter albus]|uniref:hypothetical protein n=1 Tax=Salsipaludibacter albus TaxID=2849650 RepID=UPI001EE40CC9|nr:hypothetical protein [Salsipaludibacter albus]MBY5161474.1 hypothetical protein [Salsipaludibacter albus]
MGTTTWTLDPARHRRPSRAVRLGTGLVALVVAVAVGVAIGRVTGDPGGPPAPADGPTLTRTAPSGPGPTRTVDGVPVGYTRTRAGAIAAAANYAVVLDSPAVLDAARVGPALDQIATDVARADLREQFARAAALIEERLNLDTDQLESSDIAMRSAPLGYRVVEHTPDTATIAVWGTSVFAAAGRQAVGPAWGTTEVGLHWEAGDWRVASLETTSGPVPPEAGSEMGGVVASQINRFEPFWQIPPVKE